MSFQNEDKLDWMYKSATSLVDREEYLLGRKIDKTLETLNAEEKQNELGITQPKNHVEHECIPPSIRDYNRIQVGEQQVDLATKLQEDPLVAIKKREEETRKQFLQNPIQLKKLQSTLDRQFKKTKKKKSKKHKNKADIDSIIAEKLQALKDYSLDLSFFASTDVPHEKNLDKVLLKKFRKYKCYLTEDDLQEILDSKKSTQLEESVNKDSDNDENVNYGKRKNAFEKRELQYKKSHGKSEYQKTTYNKNSTTRLTEEEKERRRKEMMENASWRDRERTNNVKRYREEEAEESKRAKDYNPDFIHKELMKSANTGSVESRIKSNINSIQRSKGDMNKHFSKRN